MLIHRIKKKHTFRPCWGVHIGHSGFMWISSIVISRTFLVLEVVAWHSCSPRCMRVTIEVSRYKKPMCISLHQRGHHLIQMKWCQVRCKFQCNSYSPKPSGKPATVPLGPKMHHQLPLDDHQPWDEAVRFCPCSVVMTGSRFHFSWLYRWGPYKFHDQHTRTTELRKTSGTTWALQTLAQSLIFLLGLLERNMFKV